MSAQRLPVPGGDKDEWGNILNGFLDVAHNPDGSLDTNSVIAAGAVTTVNSKTPVSGGVTLTAGDIGADAAGAAASAQSAEQARAQAVEATMVTTKNVPLSVLDPRIGMVNDGVTPNDGCVAALKSLVAAGNFQSIYFPGGAGYVFNNCLNLAGSGVTKIFGDNWARTRILSANNGGIGVDFSGLTPLTLEDMTFQPLNTSTKLTVTCLIGPPFSLQFGRSVARVGIHNNSDPTANGGAGSTCLYVATEGVSIDKLYSSGGDNSVVVSDTNLYGVTSPNVTWGNPPYGAGVFSMTNSWLFPKGIGPAITLNSCFGHFDISALINRTTSTYNYAVKILNGGATFSGIPNYEKIQYQTDLRLHLENYPAAVELVGVELRDPNIRVVLQSTPSSPLKAAIHLDGTATTPAGIVGGQIVVSPRWQNTTAPGVAVDDVSTNLSGINGTRIDMGAGNSINCATCVAQGVTITTPDTSPSIAFGTGSSYTLRAGNGDLVDTSHLSPAATNGFRYLASGAGAPSGVPTVRAGSVPLYIDTTNNKLWIYNGSWKGVTLS